MNLPLVAPASLPRPPSVTTETLALLCRVVELIDGARVVYVDSSDRHGFTAVRVRTANNLPRDFFAHHCAKFDPSPMLRADAARWALETARTWEVERAGDGAAWSRSGRLTALHALVREVSP